MSKLKEMIHQYVVEALEEILSEGEAPTYDVVHPKHGIIGTHNAQTGFKPSKPHLGYKSGKTVPNGASIKRPNSDTVEIKPKAKQISEMNYQDDKQDKRILYRPNVIDEEDPYYVIHKRSRMPGKVSSRAGHNIAGVTIKDKYHDPKEAAAHAKHLDKHGSSVGHEVSTWVNGKLQEEVEEVEEGLRRQRRIGKSLANAALKGGNDPTNIRKRKALKAALDTAVAQGVRSRVARMRKRLFRTPESDPHDQDF